MTKRGETKSKSNTEEFSELRELGLAPGTYGTTQETSVAALLEAIEKKKIEDVRRLIADGVDVNARYCDHRIWCSGDEFVTPLMTAVTAGSVEIVALLLKYGADPTVARELREDIGYDDFKWQGLGKYETATDFARNKPEILAVLKQLARS